MSKTVIGLDIDKSIIVGQDIDMKILNKRMITDIRAYAEVHTVKETAEYFSVTYGSMQAFLARYKIKHAPRKSSGKDNNNYKVGFALHKKLYWVYYAMLDRCYDTKSPRYKDYGARGIKVCKEWKEDNKTFFAWAIANGYREGLTLDRLDNDKGYSPDNCSWITNKENCNHNRRTHFLTYQGKTQSLKKWSEETGINYSTLRNRANRSKMSVEDILRR